jgi:transcriptional regulator with XRE-family HTH domain
MDKLIKAKEKKGVSYTEMAEALKIDRAVLSNVLHGKRYVSLEYLTPICTYLGFGKKETVEIRKQIKIKMLQKRIDDIKEGKP